MAPLFTVHTATWNRASTLHRVWESLQAQGFRDFEWLVSDDGSTDSTLALLEGWQSKARFDFRIRAFPRRVGKPVVDNDAVRAARGKYLLNADSDDAFVPRALETFRAAWAEIPPDLENRFASVTAQSIGSDGTPIGQPFPMSPYDSTPFDLNYPAGRHYDAWVCAKTSILRKFPYPELDYVVPEGVVWQHEMGRRYLTRCINETLRIVHRNSVNAITGSGKMRYNAGYAFGLAKVINNPDVDMRRKPVQAMRTYVNYGRLSHHGHVLPGQAMALLKDPAARMLAWLVYPLARLVAARDTMRGKVEYVPYQPFRGQPVETARLVE